MLTGGLRRLRSSRTASGAAVLTASVGSENQTLTTPLPPGRDGPLGNRGAGAAAAAATE